MNYFTLVIILNIGYVASNPCAQLNSCGACVDSACFWNADLNICSSEACQNCYGRTNEWEALCPKQKESVEQVLCDLRVCSLGFHTSLKPCTSREHNSCYQVKSPGEDIECSTELYCRLCESESDKTTCNAWFDGCNRFECISSGTMGKNLDEKECKYYQIPECIQEIPLEAFGDVETASDVDALNEDGLASERFQEIGFD